MPSGNLAIHIGRPGDGGAESDNRCDHEKDKQKGPKRPGRPQSLECAQGCCSSRLSMIAKIIGKTISLAK